MPITIKSVQRICTALLFTAGVVFGNSSGPPDGQHGEAQNCTSCHQDSTVNSGDGSIRVFGLPSNYLPGQTYDLTALVTGTHIRGYGFQLIAKAGSSASGTLAAVSSGMAISNGYAEHSTRSTSGSWNFQWTAPSTNEGNVTFFASGLATGGGIGSAGDQVYTFNRTLLPPPSLDWNSSVGGVIFSSPAIASDGTVYVGSNDNKLHAFNSDGSTKWAFTTGNWVDSTPAIGSDGTVYVGSWDNQLYAVNPTDGSKLWDFNTSSSITASPAIGSNGNIYFGSKDYFFYALDSSGNKLWEYFAGQPVSSSAALGQDGTIYFGDENGTFHAVNPDGSAKWTYVADIVADTNKSILSSPALDLAGSIYFGSGNGYCYSIADNGTNASLNWKVLTGDRVDASPVLGTGNEVFFVSRDGYLRSIDTITGISNWENLVGDVFYSSPAVDSNGKVYVISYIGGGENHLFAFESNGSKAWDTNGTNPPFTIGGVVDSSLALDANGKLYFGCYDKKLYAVNVGTGVADSSWPQFQRKTQRTGAWPSFNVTTASFPLAGGSVSGSGQYNEGATVSLQATPATGYGFSNWSASAGGSSLSTANPYEFNASADLAITANFTLQSYAFTIAAGAGGTVPTGLSQSYTYGSVVQISATPNPGYQFASWSGSGIADVNSKDTSVTVSGAQTATANFTLINYDLTATAGIGGSVNSVTNSYPFDTNVSLVATPSPGYSFSSWTQSGTGIADTASASTTVRMDSNQSVHATFSPLPYTLSFSAGTGGSITNAPAGTSHNFGSQVTLTAVPDSGYYFTGWTSPGITDLNATTTTLTISADQTIQASFAPIPAGHFHLQLSSSPNNSAARLLGAWVYVNGQTAQISANPIAGFTFQNWTGGTVADENASSTSVTITQDLNLTANFLGVSHQLTTSAGPGGSVNGSGTFAYGTSAQISATPDTGYTFVKWDGNLTFANQFSATTSVNITEDANVSASFAVSIHSVTVNVSGQGFSAGAGSYSYGTQVSLTANPLTGHSFSGWSGTGIADSNETTISLTITQDLNVTARFQQLPSQLNKSIDAREAVASWYASNWLGYFYQADNGWCYHFNLGWIYPTVQTDGSIWAWSPQLEWIWIEPSTFANFYVWSSDDGNWLFFDFDYASGPRIYYYLTEKWSDFDRDASIDPVDSVF